MKGILGIPVFLDKLWFYFRFCKAPEEITSVVTEGQRGLEVRCPPP